MAGTGAAQGVAWHYGDPVAEQRALVAGAGVVDLSYLGVVAVTGADRLSWLHTLTSQRLADLAPRTSTETLVLSPHGHIEHAAGVVDDGATTWLLTATPDGLAAWLGTMRFALRVEVADVTDAWAVLGEARRGEGEPGGDVVWCDPWPSTAPGGTRYGPPDDEHPGADRAWRLVLVPRADLAARVAAREGAGMRLAGTWASEALRVAAWRPDAAHEVDHRTIPHELDWLRTAVHLTKGCYRGQETVARVHNVGRPPRRLTMLHLDGSEHLLPAAGAAVSDGSGTQVGVLTSAALHHELGPVGLALLRRATPVDAALLVDGEQGPVAAAQEVVVPLEGHSVDRPAPRGPLTLGLARKRGPAGPSSSRTP
ncbi:MAG: folate-binding protein [Micrococcales bacterium]|nr:folate-binding protein [Micrococcales bacterium]